MKKVVLVLLIFACSVSVGLSTDLKTYKATYEKKMADIVVGTGMNITKINETYVKGLAQLEAKYRNEGELVPLKEVLAEKKRFTKRKNVRIKDTRNKGEQLRDFQNTYIDKFSQIRKSEGKSILDLTEKYDGALERLQKALTRQNKLDEATEVMTERERIKAAEVYIAAKKAVEDEPGVKKGKQPKQDEPVVDNAGEAVKAPVVPGIARSPKLSAKLRRDLVLRLSFDADTGKKLVSPTSEKTIAHSSAKWVKDGYYGGGMKLNAVKDIIRTRVRVPAHKKIGEITYAAWVRPDSVSEGKYQLFCPDDGGYDWSLGRSGKRWMIYDGQKAWYTTAAVDKGRWQFVAVSFSAKGKIIFMKDGMFYKGRTKGTGASGRLAIGEHPSPEEDMLFKSTVDEVMVFRTALSESDLKGLYRTMKP